MEKYNLLWREFPDTVSRYAIPVIRPHIPRVEWYSPTEGRQIGPRGLPWIVRRRVSNEREYVVPVRIERRPGFIYDSIRREWRNIHDQQYKNDLEAFGQAGVWGDRRGHAIEAIRHEPTRHILAREKIRSVISRHNYPNMHLWVVRVNALDTDALAQLIEEETPIQCAMGSFLLKFFNPNGQVIYSTSFMPVGINAGELRGRLRQYVAQFVDGESDSGKMFQGLTPAQRQMALHWIFGPVDIEYTNQVFHGGCSQKGIIRKTTAKFELLSPKSRNNNCFFNCMRIPPKTRILARLKHKELVSVGAALSICSQINRSVIIKDEKGRLLGSYIRTDPPTNLVLMDNHYYEVLQEFTQPTCILCGEKHLGKCNKERKKYRLKKNRAIFDFETRNDFTERYDYYCIIDNEQFVSQSCRQQTVAVSIVYEDESDVYVGIDCIEYLFDWIHDHPQVTTLWAHNGGRFDTYLIKEYCYKHDIPITSLIEAGGRILDLFTLGVHFRCTAQFLSGSLDGISKAFKTKIEKKKSVLIDGIERPMDDLLLYNADMHYDSYLDWLHEDSTLLSEYKEYTLLDSLVLQEVWKLFQKNMKTVITETPVDSYMTLPQMVYAHWRETTKIPFLPRGEFETYRDFVFGGRSMHTLGHYENVTYCDIVSQYPAAYCYFPFPEGELSYVGTFDKTKLGLYVIKDLKWPEPWNKFNPFPIRDDISSHLFWDVDGAEYAHCTSVDLMLADTVGATYEVVKGVVWSGFNNFFADYLLKYFKAKKLEDLKTPEERNLALRTAMKLCLNAFYGKHVQKAPDYKYFEFEKSSTDPEFEAFKGGEFTVVYGVESDKRVRYARKLTEEELNNHRYHHSHYGAFGLAWSRWILMQYVLLLDEPPLGSETDSLIYKQGTDSRFPTVNYNTEETVTILNTATTIEEKLSIIKERVIGWGKELGNMGLEFHAEEGYLIGPKIYALRHGDDWHKRWKGVSLTTRAGKELVSIEDFKALYTEGKHRITGQTVFEKKKMGGIRILTDRIKQIELKKHTKEKERAMQGMFSKFRLPEFYPIR